MRKYIWAGLTGALIGAAGPVVGLSLFPQGRGKLAALRIGYWMRVEQKQAEKRLEDSIWMLRQLKGMETAPGA